MFRFLMICGCLVAVCQAGVIGGGLLAGTAPTAVAVHPGAAGLPLSAVALPTIATSSSNILRGIGNLGAISADANSVDTPFTSVRNADVRVSNPGIVTASAVSAPLIAAANTALAAPLTTAALAGHAAVLAPGLTALGAGPALAGVAAAPLGLNGLALNGLAGLGGLGGLGALRVL